MIYLVQGLCIVALAFTSAYQSRTIRQLGERIGELARWVAEIENKNSQ